MADPISWAESVSYVISIPFGSIFDPVGVEGLAAVLCDMTTRGAGGKTSRQFLESFEHLGCETSESVGLFDTWFRASVLPDNLLPSIELSAAQILRPHFDRRQLEPARQVIAQEIYSLEDDLQQRMMLELQHNFLPYPLGRSGLGTIETIDNITIDLLTKNHASLFQPNGTVFCIAGKFEIEQVQDKINDLFASWQPKQFVLPKEKIIGETAVYIPSNSEQTYIGAVYPSVPFGAEGYMLAQCSVGILSGGTSCRLFSELREKRGLCYSVSASYSALRDRAAVYCYCGASTEHAQETLNVLLSELDRLRFG
ncbi:MAG: insulinase family protein, partial [Planctomycetaceae bacterium]|nr:insulinase family protein [Planctomycetaceae bacterium]